MYALYMILLTFDLSTPVKYERIGVYETNEECELYRDILTTDNWRDETWSPDFPSEWVEPVISDDGEELIFKEHPMPLRYGCVWMGATFDSDFNQYMSN